MKPPLSYYGGKQNMVKHLLPLIPPHDVYVEPFAGGAALFFAKKPAPVEVLSDKLDQLTTFYRVMHDDFEGLDRLIQGTLHSESAYIKSKHIFRNPEGFSDLERAWATWVQCNMSFGSEPLRGFAYAAYRSGKKGSGKKGIPLSIQNKKARFALYKTRLENATIFNRDALDIPLVYDTTKTLWYFDPPYFNSDMGHYKGYSWIDFGRLLIFASKLKGRFILSSYPSPLLIQAVKKFGWNYREITQSLSVDGRRKESATKTECITWNFDEPGKPYTLF